MIVHLQYKYYLKNTGMTSLTARVISASPTSYFVILRASWLLHRAFLLHKKTPHITYQVSVSQTFPSFSSTPNFSSISTMTQTRSKPIVTKYSKRSPRRTRSPTKSRSSDGSPDLSPTPKPPPKTIPQLIQASGLASDASFVVPKVSAQANGPPVMTPTKANAGVNVHRIITGVSFGGCDHWWTIGLGRDLRNNKRSV